MSHKPCGKDLFDNYSVTQNFDAIASSHIEIFQSTLKEIQQRIQKAVGMCQPYSLVHKELKDILLVTRSKEADIKKMEQELAAATERKSLSRTLLDSQSKFSRASHSYLEESLTEEISVQSYQKHGKELLSECKLTLDEMKSKNQSLKSLYQQPLGSRATTPTPSIDGLKFQPNSPAPYQSSTRKPTFSDLRLSSTGTLPTFEQDKHVETQTPKPQTSSSNEVLANIEKFMQSFDQRNEGQNKRIQNITREIDTLKEHVQSTERITEKIEQDRNFTQGKASSDNINKFLSTSPKDFWNKELQVVKITPKTATGTAERPNGKFNEPEGLKKADKINEIHNTLDECSKFLARKRLESLNTSEIEKPCENNNNLASPVKRRMQEKQSRNISMDFDMNAILNRRESRLKSFFEREERMKKEQNLPEQNQSSSFKSAEELNLTQTLKRSDIDRKPLYEYYSSGKDRIVYCYENELPSQGEEKLSQMNTPSKVEEELTSTRKSCLVKRGRLSSKENSGTKAEKKLRFADEQETPARALKFEEISDPPLNPLEQKDLNAQLPPKTNVKKAVLRGEISQLDREIKRISQLLHSVVLTETI